MKNIIHHISLIIITLLVILLTMIPKTISFIWFWGNSENVENGDHDYLDCCASVARNICGPLE